MAWSYEEIRMIGRRHSQQWVSSEKARCEHSAAASPSEPEIERIADMVAIIGPLQLHFTLARLSARSRSMVDSRSRVLPVPTAIRLPTRPSPQ
jgi:hypothetical protein